MCDEYKPFKEFECIFHMHSSADIDKLFEKISAIDNEFTDYCPSQHYRVPDGIYQRTKNLLEIFEYPVTVVYDRYYVDKVYRDEYYEYYARKHFEISRNTKRFVFIKGIYNKSELLNSSETLHKRIESSIIGMIVLKPTKTVGRILIDPRRIIIPHAHIRTTDFQISVLGLLYHIQAFPSSGQDKEVMTCAEVNIWQIMEFFGKHFDHYKALLPSELLSLTKENSDVRVLPSEGLTDEQESFLFLRSGFAPKIYYKMAEREFHDEVRLYEEYKDPSFENILHIYVSSGIPVLLNLVSKDDNTWDGHSITCIGYINNDITGQNAIVKKSIDNNDVLLYDGIRVIESWTQDYKYVFMEDHSNPYYSADLNNLVFSGLQGEWKVESFVVPLYKHIFVSAEDACRIIEKIIAQTSDKVKSTVNGSDLVLNLFLVSSKSYKEFRISHANNTKEKIFYSQMNYPKYLWISEYSTKELIKNGIALGEYVIDATASKQPDLTAVISIRHSLDIMFRNPFGKAEDVLEPYDIDLGNDFKAYQYKNPI